MTYLKYNSTFKQNLNKNENQENKEKTWKFQNSLKETNARSLVSWLVSVSYFSRHLNIFYIILYYNIFFIYGLKIRKCIVVIFTTKLIVSIFENIITFSLNFYYLNLLVISLWKCIVHFTRNRYFGTFYYVNAFFVSDWMFTICP